MINNFKLPEFVSIPTNLRKGRNIKDGYSRGWGLQFGDLKEKILKDQLYQEAFEISRNRTVQSEVNRMNLYLILKFYLNLLPRGHILEFGSYKGGSAIFMAKVCSVLSPETHIYAFDTFSGMPPTDLNVDAHRAGDFSDVDFSELKDFVLSCGLNNLHLVQGHFENSVPKMLPKIESVRLTHIDCDIYSAVKYSYEISIPYMVKGGYIILDDPLYSSCLGATEVVEDIIIRRDGLNSEQVYPHFVFRSGLD
jgi:hypothetical protein